MSRNKGADPWARAGAGNEQHMAGLAQAKFTASRAVSQAALLKKQSATRRSDATEAA